MSGKPTTYTARRRQHTAACCIYVVQSMMATCAPAHNAHSYFMESFFNSYHSKADFPEHQLQFHALIMQ